MIVVADRVRLKETAQKGQNINKSIAVRSPTLKYVATQVLGLLRYSAAGNGDRMVPRLVVA